MKKPIQSWLKVLLAMVFGLGIALAQSSPGSATNLWPHAEGQAAIIQKQIQAAYGKLPLNFEVNLGQTDEQVKFLSRGNGYSLFLTPTEAVLALSTPQGKSSSVSHRPTVKPQPTAKTTTNVLRMQLLGSNCKPQVSWLEQLPGKVNYFLDNDPKQWHTNIPTYAKVQYQQVYPGVDMVYYGNQRQLEYNFVIAPGTDPNTIKLALLGADNLEVDAQGNLVLHTTGGQIQLYKPLFYQEVDGVRQAILGGYVLQDQHVVRFRVEGYNPIRPLIIDPVLAYSTFLGGSGGDNGLGIAVDQKGNAYVTGNTFAPDFPTKNPLQPTSGGGNEDAFVAKLNPEGSALVYSTYLGGSSNDVGDGIAVDAKSNAYVTGTTSSTDFPTENPLQPTSGGGNEDAFVAKLNPEGSALVYSTYLGGSLSDYGYGIAVNVIGNAYVTGVTYSTDFPTENPLQPTSGGGNEDAFVAKLNPEGSALVYSTYLGGSGSEGEVGKLGSGIAVDTKGNAYVTGSTSSTDFPTKNPLQPTYGGRNYDAFVAKLNPEGSFLIYSTYLGGSLSDYGSGIAVDAKDNAYVTGLTNSTNFPTKNPLQPTLGGEPGNAFVAKLNPEGSFLIYSTYLGGSRGDYGQSIAVDAKGNVYVTGTTSSTDFPTKNPLQPPFDRYNTDAFVAKLNPEGSALVYSTHLGGGRFDFGYAIAVDTKANAYVTGSTSSTDFLTKNPLQPTFSGSFQGGNTPFNAFVTKITP